jgi:hypothetical protein
MIKYSLLLNFPLRLENTVFVRIIIATITTLFLSACSLSPKDTAYNRTIDLGCSVGNADAFVDIKNKTVDDGYLPKEELKIFSFGEYKVPDDEKEGFEQLFRLSARGCYLSEIQKMEEKRKKTDKK